MKSFMVIATLTASCCFAAEIRQISRTRTVYRRKSDGTKEQIRGSGPRHDEMIDKMLRDFEPVIVGVSTPDRSVRSRVAEERPIFHIQIPLGGRGVFDWMRDSVKDSGVLERLTALPAKYLGQQPRDLLNNVMLSLTNRGLNTELSLEVNSKGSSPGASDGRRPEVDSIHEHESRSDALPDNDEGQVRDRSLDADIIDDSIFREDLFVEPRQPTTSEASEEIPTTTDVVTTPTDPTEASTASDSESTDEDEAWLKKQVADFSAFVQTSEIRSDSSTDPSVDHPLPQSTTETEPVGSSVAEVRPLEAVVTTQPLVPRVFERTMESRQDEAKGPLFEYVPLPESDGEFVEYSSHE